MLSTFWQRAGCAGHNLAIYAIAIMLAEAYLFDDEKDKAAQKATEQAQKHTADGQLQPTTNKHSRTTTGTNRSNITLRHYRLQIMIRSTRKWMNISTPNIDLASVADKCAMTILGTMIL